LYFAAALEAGHRVSIVDNPKLGTTRGDKVLVMTNDHNNTFKVLKGFNESKTASILR
jgi:hypothetical protein